MYSSKSRGKWLDWDHVKKLTPDGWKSRNNVVALEEDVNESIGKEESVSNKKSDATWARLVKKIYNVDSLICPKCASEMKIFAIITDSYEISKILKHLVKKGKSPPGFDKVCLDL